MNINMNQISKCEEKRKEIGMTKAICGIIQHGLTENEAMEVYNSIMSEKLE